MLGLNGCFITWIGLFLLIIILWILWCCCELYGLLSVTSIACYNRTHSIHSTSHTKLLVGLPTYSVCHYFSIIYSFLLILVVSVCYFHPHFENFYPFLNNFLHFLYLMGYPFAYSHCQLCMRYFWDDLHYFSILKLLTFMIKAYL